MSTIFYSVDPGQFAIGATDAGQQFADQDADVQAAFLVAAAERALSLETLGSWYEQCGRIVAEIDPATRDAVREFLLVLADRMSE